MVRKMLRSAIPADMARLRGALTHPPACRQLELCGRDVLPAQRNSRADN
jgi:hypothetical protein